MKFATLLLLFSFVFVFLAKSQFTKGDKYIGGNGSISFNSAKSENSGSGDYKGTQFSLLLTPRISWVTSNNTMIGIAPGIGYGYSKSYYNGSPDYTTSSGVPISLRFFYRKYYNFSAQTGWFVEYNVHGSYAIYTDKTFVSGVAYKNNSRQYAAGAGLYPGFFYKINPATLIEASFGGLNTDYGMVKSGSYKNSNFSLNVTFPSSLSFGVQFLLRCKKKK